MYLDTAFFFELKVLMLELWVLGLLHGLVALNLHTEIFNKS